VEEFWIDNVLENSSSTQNMRGTYSTYGINQVIFDNYWNAGAPAPTELYRDNIVIATERIGCITGSELPQPKTSIGIGLGAGMGLDN